MYTTFLIGVIHSSSVRMVLPHGCLRFFRQDYVIVDMPLHPWELTILYWWTDRTLLRLKKALEVEKAMTIMIVCFALQDKSLCASFVRSDFACDSTYAKHVIVPRHKKSHGLQTQTSPVL